MSYSVTLSSDYRFYPELRIPAAIFAKAQVAKAEFATDQFCEATFAEAAVSEAKDTNTELAKANS